MLLLYFVFAFRYSLRFLLLTGRWRRPRFKNISFRWRGDHGGRSRRVCPPVQIKSTYYLKSQWVSFAFRW